MYDFDCSKFHNDINIIVIVMKYSISLSKLSIKKNYLYVTYLHVMIFSHVEVHISSHIIQFTTNTYITTQSYTHNLT